ncbi:hypothetical protein [Staphylococcus capitis]|uniref:hypothetical protein n=1 Tax=Staphylococcus capitis TaxID=29388 RepID=UPI000D1A241F|nr:hypothetical protein [Staphylococcus capitis]PTG25933.1 hypothetical protein BU628_06035 [Staphylococcus capitis]PTG30521.1 hypothetical protein BU630_05325 [Staphylococcus capitis]PTG37318.1 hypothetical protein BU624_07255 [Staphylococcus capitis]PTG98006.1 hypothetical protein BU625_07445 [Staphylococcus capitis]PTH05368.1 hypothetical protein BU621_04070 [Staphylococcus capitis]
MLICTIYDEIPEGAVQDQNWDGLTATRNHTIRSNEYKSSSKMILIRNHFTATLFGNHVPDA